MNLPLVEAQALGTPGLAFDTGAHPEFTPLLYRSVADVAEQIAAYHRDRRLFGRARSRRARLRARQAALGRHRRRDGAAHPRPGTRQRS